MRGPKWCMVGRLARVVLLFLVHFLPTWLTIFLVVSLLSPQTTPAPAMRQHTFYRASGGSHMRYFGSAEGVGGPVTISGESNRPIRLEGYLSAASQRLRHTYKMPFNVIVVLPTRESNNDKFGLTSEVNTI